MYNHYMLLLILLSPLSECLVPAKFQWKKMDYAWPDCNARKQAIACGDYVPENVMPTGLAKWRDKLFIVIPRWKSGVPASLNYIDLSCCAGTVEQPLLQPYPTWRDAFVTNKACCAPTNETVVSAFKVTVDNACNRLWVVDNGVVNMFDGVKQIASPSIMIFDLETDVLIHKRQLKNDVLRKDSVLSNIVVDTPGCGKCRCSQSFAYITDMGSNAIIVYDLNEDNTTRVESNYFKFDPSAGQFLVGGVQFCWTDGISSATLSHENCDGFRYLYFHPISSTKLFRMSTRYLKSQCCTQTEIADGIECVGEKGPMGQATSCFYDPESEVLFYTLLNQNAIGCWNSNKPFNEENAPIIFRDCNLLEFPSDLTVDADGNIWILSNCQSRFLSSKLDYDSVNFRVLTAPVKLFIKGTPCEKMGCLSKMFTPRPKSKEERKRCCQSS